MGAYFGDGFIIFCVSRQTDLNYDFALKLVVAYRELCWNHAS